MSDFVWILDSEKSRSFGNKGIFSSYIIPKEDITIEPKELVGKRLWIVLRKHDDRLLKLIKIKKIERIIEGYYVGDFLIFPDISESFKLISSYAEGEKYKILDTAILDLGIFKIARSLSNELYLFVKSKMQIKLLPPTEHLLSKTTLKILPNNYYQLAKMALRAVTSRLTLDQIWANGVGDKLSAFSNFALALIDREIDPPHRVSLINELKILDPVFMLFDLDQIKAPKNNTHKKESPCIDIEFTEIDPEQIYVREFLSVDSKFANLEEALKKTEHAEKIHQQMLKDISLFLISQGITPYESASIDLIYSSNNKLNLFEIKSTNVNNILAQTAKGMFQLACYLNELSKNYNNLHVGLILHKTENIDLNRYVVEVLLQFDINVLFYDPTKPWPTRVQGFPH